eukprot:scaffold30170_cov140-Isochrysis_galbana.AAC.1
MARVSSVAGAPSARYCRWRILSHHVPISAPERNTQGVGWAGASGLPRSACSSTAARAASGCCTPRAAVAMPLTRTARRLEAGGCGVARADTAGIRLKSSTTLEQDLIAERLLAPGAGRALLFSRTRVAVPTRGA